MSKNIAHHIRMYNKYKNIKMYEDVGMAMPRTIETRCSYGSMQARQG